MIARARERKLDLEHVMKRKAESEQVSRVSGKKPKDPTLGRRASPTRVAAGNPAGRMRELVERDRPAATSAARRGTMAEIVLPPPPQCRCQT